MSPENQNSTSPENQFSHIRTREEVMAIQAAEARKENMRRLAERLGGVTLENTPNPSDTEQTDPTEDSPEAN